MDATSAIVLIRSVTPGGECNLAFLLPASLLLSLQELLLLGHNDYFAIPPLPR